MANLMTVVLDICNFIFGGNAYFTLVSPTGTRFTYRIYEPKKLKGNNPYGVRYVAVLTGSENTTNYTYIGSLTKQNGYKYKSNGIGSDATSVKAITWTLGKLQKGNDLGAVEFWHEGRCGRCGKKLTVPTSIANGIGPECMKMM